MDSNEEKYWRLAATNKAAFTKRVTDLKLAIEELFKVNATTKEIAEKVIALYAQSKVVKTEDNDEDGEFMFGKDRLSIGTGHDYETQDVNIYFHRDTMPLWNYDSEIIKLRLTYGFKVSREEYFEVYNDKIEVKELELTEKLDTLKMYNLFRDKTPLTYKISSRYDA
jgi:hypothetical protein